MVSTRDRLDALQPDAGEFGSQYLGHLRSFAGLQFLVLLVGSPDNLLAPLARGAN